MSRYALTGRAYSGKTTLAAWMERRGYALWSYTDYLKELLARALTAVGVPTTLDDILADKERYRPLLVPFSTVIGFDGPAWVERFIQEHAARFGSWRYETQLVNARDTNRVLDGLPEDLVWDNCRFPHQFAALRKYGFRLVILDIDDTEQARRAANLGVSPSRLAEMRHEITEQRFLPDDYEGAVTLDATLPTWTQANVLLTFGGSDVEWFPRENGG